MQRSWWIPLVQWTLWGVSMSVVMGWVARSRMRPRAGLAPSQLQHPPSTLIIGLVGFLFFAGVAVVSNTVGKNSTTSVWTTLAFIVFAMILLAMVAEYFLARHHLTADGLEFGKLLGPRGSFRWVDVRSIEYAPVMKWFKIKTEHGATVRISVMLIGLPAFAQQALAGIDASRIQQPTRQVLLETASGRPPSVWN